MVNKLAVLQGAENSWLRHPSVGGGDGGLAWSRAFSSAKALADHELSELAEDLRKLQAAVADQATRPGERTEHCGSARGGLDSQEETQEVALSATR